MNKPQLGDRTYCTECELDLEYNGQDWWDRGGNYTCPKSYNRYNHSPAPQEG